MKVEIHINGSHQVILIPEDAVEAAVLSRMLDGAGKGKAVKLCSRDRSESYDVVVSVEA